MKTIVEKLHGLLAADNKGPALWNVGGETSKFYFGRRDGSRKRNAFDSK